MTDETLIIERLDGIAIVKLNDTNTRNALSPRVVDGLLAFLNEAKGDEDLRCIVLTGTGSTFCSGGNLLDMRDGTDAMFRGSPAQMQNAYRRGIQQIPLTFNALEVPVVAALNGPAIGAGCDLACMCDIRIASDKALFAESFLRVGLISGDGGAWFLPQVVGLARAMDMALTCRSVDAELAERWGLVTSLVPAEELLEEAINIARTIAAFPPISTRLNKRLIRRSLGLSLDESLELAASFQAIVQSTQDQKKAVSAMLDKREPVYTGK